MKIGILTLPLHTNYGGILQAYALQTVLERMGHEVCIIEEKKLHKLPLWKMPLAYTKRFILKYILRKRIRIFAERYEAYSYPIVTQHTHKFIDQYINIYKVDNLRYVPETRFDAIVVGSDQIWRPRYYKNIENAYLKFTKGWNIRRVAYAASFGSSKWEYRKRETESCKKLIANFDLVSIREANGQKLCETYLGHKAYHVVDPTLLLAKEDYMRLITGYQREAKGDLMVYFLDGKSSTWAYICKYAKKHHLTPFRANSKFEDFNAPIEQRIQPPVENWLTGFCNARLVLTDSFHACVFSILFKKDFYAVCNSQRGNDRFISLLDSLGLSDRMLTSIDDIHMHNLKHIDYDSVYEKLNKNKEYSTSLLKKGLGDE